MEKDQYSRKPIIKATAYTNRLVWEKIGVNPITSVSMPNGYAATQLDSGTFGFVYKNSNSQASVGSVVYGVQVTDPNNVSQWNNTNTFVIYYSAQNPPYESGNNVSVKPIGNKAIAFYEYYANTAVPPEQKYRNLNSFSIDTNFASGMGDLTSLTTANLYPDFNFTSVGTEYYIVTSESWSISKTPINYQTIGTHMRDGVVENFPYFRNKWSIDSINSCYTFNYPNTIVYFAGRPQSVIGTTENSGIYALFTNSGSQHKGFYSDPIQIESIDVEYPAKYKITNLGVNNLGDEIGLTYIIQTETDSAVHFIRSKDGINFTKPVYLPKDIEKDAVWFPLKKNGQYFMASRAGVYKSIPSSSVVLDELIIACDISEQPESAAKTMDMTIRNDSNSMQLMDSLRENSKIALSLGYSDKIQQQGVYYIDSVHRVAQDGSNDLIIKSRDGIKHLKNWIAEKPYTRHGPLNYFDDFLQNEKIGRPYVDPAYWQREGDIGWGDGGTAHAIELNIVGVQDKITYNQLVKDGIFEVRVKKSNSTCIMSLNINQDNEQNHYHIQWLNTGVIRLIEDTPTPIVRAQATHTDVTTYHAIKLVKQGMAYMFFIDNSLVASGNFAQALGYGNFQVQSDSGTNLVDWTKISALERINITQTLGQFIGSKNNIDYSFDQKSVSMATPLGGGLIITY